MGGNVFNDHVPPIDIPRMPPDVYRTLLNNTIRLLRNHYARVETAIEAPEKIDYGDIDILISSPRESCYDLACRSDALESLSELLNSAIYKHHKNNPSHFFAIGWPDSHEKHAIVDIQYFENESKLNWSLFQTAHGDMCAIFGHMVRSLKLVINDEGLHITIPELEVQDVAKRDRLVLLTSEPDEVLDFFGVEGKRYWKKFDTVQDMLEYATTCHFFWATQKTNDQSERKDKKKSSHRKNFARWKEEFIPQCEKTTNFCTQQYTAETARSKAFETFQGVEAAYKAKLHAWKLRENEKQVKLLIRRCVSIPDVEGNLRSAAIRIYEQILLFHDVPEYIDLPEEIRCGDDGLWDLNVLEVWITATWKTTGTRALEDRTAKSSSV